MPHTNRAFLFAILAHRMNYVNISPDGQRNVLKMKFNQEKYTKKCTASCQRGFMRENSGIELNFLNLTTQ